MKRTILALDCAFIICISLSASAQTTTVLLNKQLAVTVRPSDGDYEILSHGLQQPVLISQAGAEIDHQWITASEYRRHKTTKATFQDALGSGHALTITFSGLANEQSLLLATITGYPTTRFELFKNRRCKGPSAN